MNATLAAIAAASVLVPALVVSNPPRIVPARALEKARAKVPPRRVLAPTELPAVEPVALVDLTADEARAYNDIVPFVGGPNPAARPFRFAGTPDDRARATDCLAAAVIYEAGDDATGERAVAQVVLNRLRHPAFPKTVCGVVFEGQERTTGCQFTFTCDGALTRWKPSEAGWRRAREVATLALAGGVFRPVGYATHYHTDWVVPYWQSSLDKLARVGTHLFFRWTGWWGTPPAFNRQVTRGEPAVAKLAPLSPAHLTGAALAEAEAALGEAAALTTGDAGVTPPPLPGVPAPTAADPDTFLVTLNPAAAPDSYRALALRVCGDRPHCIFMGWTDAKRTPAARPLSDDQLAAMAFSYLREKSAGFERVLWNCDAFPRPDPAQCMKRAPRPEAAKPPPAAPRAVATPVPTPKASPSPAAPLPGVRRRES